MERVDGLQGPHGTPLVPFILMGFLDNARDFWHKLLPIVDFCCIQTFLRLIWTFFCSLKAWALFDWLMACKLQHVWLIRMLLTDEFVLIGARFLLQYFFLSLCFLMGAEPISPVFKKNKIKYSHTVESYAKWEACRRRRLLWCVYKAAEAAALFPFDESNQ